MAVKKNTEVAQVQETQPTAKESELQNQVDELKALVAQLLESQKAQPVTKEDNKEDLYHNIEDELNISPHKLIRVVSMTMGGLSLQGANGKVPTHFRDFGSSKTVTFEDVRAFVDNHHELALGGGFIIQDKSVIKALYLEDEYKKLLSKEKVEKLIDLPGKEIISILEASPKTLQDNIVQYFIRMIPKDNRYTDWNKIKLISDFVGQDLMELAKEIEE